MIGSRDLDIVNVAVNPTTEVVESPSACKKGVRGCLETDIGNIRRGSK